MIAIKKDAMRYRDPETGKFVGVSLIGGDAPSGSGGATVEIDGTLTQSGKAADAKAVGDQLSALNAAIDAKGDPTDEQVSTAVNAYLTEHPVSGLSDTASALLITILRGAVYSSDQSVNITALENALGNGGSGTPEEPIVTTYTISSELINCTSSNSATSVNENDPYTATLTANDGYTLVGATVSVTMGGADITNTAYADGVITIAAVTGNVEIIASAVAVQAGSALPEDGLLATFDLRNLSGEQMNVAVGSAKGMKATTGNGALFSWAGTPIMSSSANGSILSRSLMYSNDGSSSSYMPGGDFTCVAYGYGCVSSTSAVAMAYTNISSDYGALTPKYKNSSGVQASGDKLILSAGDFGVKEKYNVMVAVVKGSVLTVYINGKIAAEVDGSSYGDFSSWASAPSNASNAPMSISTSYNGEAPSVFCAFYNRAISASEAMSVFEYIESLEVSA